MQFTPVLLREEQVRGMNGVTGGTVNGAGAVVSDELRAQEFALPLQKEGQLWAAAELPLSSYPWFGHPLIVAQRELLRELNSPQAA